jgi:23S rRNA (pseudouridine1915-N3)-methyltransferase
LGKALLVHIFQGFFIERQGREEIVFITGGPLGLSFTLLKECHFILSLSKLTLTHEMCRLIIVFEQVYRAYTIKAGEKYHK